MQCLVLVRDDFWMAATRFMGELEVPLVEGRNSAAVDLFPVRHAEKVLAAFGRAFGALPEHPGKLAREQRHFVEQAVAGPCPGGEGDLRAAGAVRPDDERPALDAGVAARGGQAPSGLAPLSSKRPSAPPARLPSTAITRRRPGPS